MAGRHLLVVALSLVCGCECWSFSPLQNALHTRVALKQAPQQRRTQPILCQDGDRLARRDLLESLGTVTSSSLLLSVIGQSPSPAAADVQLQYGSGSFSGTSVVNGVLSAYGLPQLPNSKGFTPFLQQFKDTVVEFKYPSNWVVNNKAKFAESGLKNGPTGITVSDYRTAEGLTLFTLAVDAQSIDQVKTTTVADLVVDGGSSQGSSALEYKLVKEAKLPEEGYKSYTFSWESVTVSGYEVERYGVASATVRKGVLYVLFGVVAKPRAKAMGPSLKEVGESFRVFTI
mmetsp:Transcript_41675/g.83529  ORF Transcript_41675/g.83529 Transcript_41675/m.83529 type:complete len:287 (+) Transcript_41675:1-861(+)